MFIKKRGKAKQEKDKANRAAAGAAGGDGADAAAGADGSARSVMTNEDDFDHRLGCYQLMEAIGKGGYGTVYRGLNIERGMTVAVKRVNLQGIPHEELESIEVRTTSDTQAAAGAVPLALPSLHCALADRLASKAGPLRVAAGG